MPSTLKNGLTLHDRYQVEQIIKETKFYRIYLIEDQNEGNENCILREFIAREIGGAANVGVRFQTDLHQLQGLKHPQIEQFKDFFWEGEQLFIVQSYFEGKTYQDWLRARPLTEEEAVGLFKQILPVLSYLHNEQLAHRDISPSNLLLRSPDNLPVLTNFGTIRDIMAVMGLETPETKLLNRVREFPIDISPGVDEDLYALAVTGVILLTGKDIQDLFNSQSQTWDWEKWKLVSDQLSEVLNRMLAVQPTNRFESANAILQALNSSPIPPPPTIPVIYSPEVPSQPTWASYQSPTGVYQPNNNISFQSEQINTPPPGIKNWQKAVIIGSVIGGVLLAGIVLAQRQNLLGFLKSPSSPSSPPIIPFPSPSLSPSPTAQSLSPSSPPLSPSPSSSPLSISRQEAVNLVQKWLEAKQVMFAPPYNRQIAAEIATGKQYEENAGSNGSIDWLENKGAYYRFGIQRIDSVEQFIANNNQAKIQVKVTEDRKLYNSNGTIDRKETDFKTRTVIYYLQSVNGAWKIADSQILSN